MEPVTELPAVANNAVVGVVVLLSLNIVVKVGEFVWKLKERKDSVTEKGIQCLTEAVNKNTEVSNKLEDRLRTVETQLQDYRKIKLDLRRCYTALKLLSGDRWSEIRKAIMEDEDTT